MSLLHTHILDERKETLVGSVKAGTNQLCTHMLDDRGETKQGEGWLQQASCALTIWIAGQKS